MGPSVQDILTLFRREVDDPAYYMDRNLPAPNTLWSNFELIQILDQGQKVFAEKTLCFKDQRSFRPAVTANDPWIKYDERILRIERVEVASTNRIIPHYTIEDFVTKHYTDDYGLRYPGSWETKLGPPQCVITDMEAGYLRLFPIPEEDDTLLLTVRRYPMEDITSATEEFEIPSRWKYGMLYFLEKEAFRKPSALERGYEKALRTAKASWDEFLGDAQKRIQVRTRGPGQMRYGGL